MIIQKEKISNLYYLGLLFVVAICTFLAMPDMDNQTDVGSGLTVLTLIGLSVLQIPLLIYIFHLRLKSELAVPKFIIYYGIYFIWMIGITLLNDTTHNIKGLIIIALSLCVFPFMLYCSYYRTRSSDVNKWFYAGVMLIFLCIMYQYYNLYSIVTQLNDTSGRFAISYFPLFVLPLLLLSPSRVVRYVSIIITTIIIISAIKRGGIIALGISIFIYVLVKQLVEGRSKIRQLIIIGIVLLLMGGVVYGLTQSETNNIIERIMNIKDDGGSSRDVLWQDTFYNIQNRDFMSGMIGDGYRAAQTVSIYHLPAHNDGLEIWYDFGFIGLILYSMAFISLLVYTIRLIKRKSRYAPHMAMTIVFYFFFSMISIVILYYWMLLVMLTVGILTGLAERELKEENNNEAQKIIVES